MRRGRPNRLGRRFMWASLGVLAVAVIMIVIAAQQMFINDQDLGFLLWILVPATIAAALVALALSAPLARDAERLSEAATRIAAGDLTARSGVRRADELGDAAAAFDRMAARLDAVEQERALMLASISHDLRTPLAAIRASVEAIRDGVAADPDALLGAMEHQVAALAALVDDLRLHTRIASGTLDSRMVRLDIAELVDEVVEAVRPLADRSGVAVRTLADGPVLVTGDPVQLSRVFRNLLDNAIRYADGVVAVEVGVNARDGAEVVVTDDGPGFPHEFRDTAFEPFTRGDPSRNATTGNSGLGLAIARGIVRAHGGDVTIADGTGGRLVVRIPAIR